MQRASDNQSARSKCGFPTLSAASKLRFQSSCLLAESRQVDALEATLTTRHPHWLGFCHNDLQCGNVMLDKAPPRLVRIARPSHRTADMSISQVRAKKLCCCQARTDHALIQPAHDCNCDVEFKLNARMSSNLDAKPSNRTHNIYLLNSILLRPLPSVPLQ